MSQFLSGAFAAVSVAIGLFFLRFWQRSRDRLFALLALAFLLLAAERTVMAFVPAALDGRHLIYFARLVAFALIILGVIDKNRRQRGNVVR
jgi:hypothetical protein